MQPFFRAVLQAPVEQRILARYKEHGCTSVAAIIAGVAAAIEQSIQDKTGNALFGAVSVRKSSYNPQH